MSQPALYWVTGNYFRREPLTPAQPDCTGCAFHRAVGWYPCSAFPCGNARNVAKLVPEALQIPIGVNVVICGASA